MARSSAALPFTSTQSFASVEAPKLRLAVAGRTEQIRALLIQHLPHGTKLVIAEILGSRKERISRELQGVEKLSEELVDVAIEILRLEGEREISERICSLRDGDRSWVVTRHADGSVEWRFQ
jgi:biotin synthase-related radical SAM superfamily protein